MSPSLEDAQAGAEQKFIDAGWGRPLTFEVERTLGRPLVLQFRLPVGVALLDLKRLSGTATGAPASVGRASDALARARSSAGVIVLGAMCPAPKPDTELELLATLTVAFSEVAGPPVIEDQVPPGVKQQVERISDKVTRIQRLSAEALEPEQEPVLMLVVQYLLQTQFGALGFNFSTSNPEMFGQWARQMYRELVKTCWIGEPSRP